METFGKVRPTIVGHQVERNADGGYKVTCTEDLVLEVKTEAGNKRLTPENVAGLADMGKISQSSYIRLVTSVQYNPKKNKMVPNYPVVFPKDTYNLKAGEFKKLA